MRNVALIGGGWYANRGCEAIVRSTKQILSKALGDIHLDVFSYYPNSTAYHLQESREKDGNIKHYPIQHYQYNQNQIFRHKALAAFVSDSLIYNNHFSMKLKKTLLKQMRETLDSEDLILFIGGDLYSAESGVPVFPFVADSYATSLGKKTILWGASPGILNNYPFLERMFAKHLDAMNLVVARDRLSENYFKTLSKKVKVIRHFDPAFSFESEPPKDNIQWSRGAFVGLNLSPIMSRYTRTDWAILSRYIIKNMLDETGGPILLIPHVITGGIDCDYLFMKRIISNLDSDIKENVVLLDPYYTAAETKWIISRCRGFVGCRMHSFVGAITTGVPSILITYSTKGIGLCRDLEANYISLGDLGSGNNKVESVFKNVFNSDEEKNSIIDKNVRNAISDSSEAGVCISNIS